MKNDNAVTWRIAQLASRLDPSLVTGLWILRAASPDYQPAYEQLGIGDMVWEPASGEATPATAWDAVVSAPEDGRISAAARALEGIMPQSLLPEQMMALPPLGRSGENALGELIGILSDISPETAALTRLYPYSERGNSALSRYDGAALPHGILRLLLSCLDLESGSRVYDPCYSTLLSQTASLLPQAKTLRFCAQALEPAAYQLAHIHAYLQGIDLDLGGKAGDTLTEDLFAGRRFDCILANPPFNQANWYDDPRIEGDARWQYGLPPRSNGNFAWLQHVVSHLDGHGRGVVILPNGTLTTRTQAEREIREGLLQAGQVEAIIALPAGIFSNTKVPCCVWLLRGEKAAGATTLFIDAQGLTLTEGEDLLKLTGAIHQHRRGLLEKASGWYAAATLADIREKNGMLSPNFYTRATRLSPASAEEKRPQLLALIDDLEPQLRDSGLYPSLEQWKHTFPAKHWEKAPVSGLYRISGGIVKEKSAFGYGTPMADVVTVIRNPFLPSVLPGRVEVSLAEMEKYRVRAGDIFLNRSSENTQELACCCVAAEDREAVFGGYLKRLRPLGGEHPNPYYMAAYFRSGIYREEIVKVSPVYTTRSNINVERLSGVQVYYPDDAMQEKLGKTMLAVFRFRENCFDQGLNARLEEFTRLLIEQFITYPVLRMEDK